MLELPLIGQADALDALRAVVAGFEQEERSQEGAMISVEQLRQVLGRGLPALANKEQYALAYALLMVVRPPVTLKLYNTPRDECEQMVSLIRRYLTWFRHTERYGWQLERLDMRYHIKIRIGDLRSSVSVCL